MTVYQQYYDTEDKAWKGRKRTISNGWCTSDPYQVEGDSRWIVDHWECRK